MSTERHIVARCEATPVTKGKFYAYLPFLYDEEARAIRDAILDKQAAPEHVEADQRAS